MNDYACVTCTKRFSTPFNLNRHMNKIRKCHPINESENTKYICAGCKHSYKKEDLLHVHQELCIPFIKFDVVQKLRQSSENTAKIIASKDFEISRKNLELEHVIGRHKECERNFESMLENIEKSVPNNKKDAYRKLILYTNRLQKDVILQLENLRVLTDQYILESCKLMPVNDSKDKMNTYLSDILKGYIICSDVSKYEFVYRNEDKKLIIIDTKLEMLLPRIFKLIKSDSLQYQDFIKMVEESDLIHHLSIVSQINGLNSDIIKQFIAEETSSFEWDQTLPSDSDSEKLEEMQSCAAKC